MGVSGRADARRHTGRRRTALVRLAGRPAPDFVKVFLLESEEHARRCADPKFFGNRGLDPALVPLIVARAHAAGLHVSAHVSSAADFRIAVDGGVDQIAHVPGQRSNDPSPYLLTDTDGANAAAHYVPVITTVAMRNDSALTDRIVREVYAHNIDALRRHGVPLLIGSDIMRGTAPTEAAALARSGLFTNAELLRLWSIDTPRAIFPKRKIGGFDDGYEASFLVLRDDPLTAFGRRAPSFDG
jgi:imidazolonepropionase-like amidohydrolase